MNVNIEVFGSWATGLDRVFILPDYPGAIYIVSARCREGCHTLRHAIASEQIPTFFPEMERLINVAYKQAHPDSPQKGTLLHGGKD